MDTCQWTSSCRDEVWSHCSHMVWASESFRGDCSFEVEASAVKPHSDFSVRLRSPITNHGCVIWSELSAKGFERRHCELPDHAGRCTHPDQCDRHLTRYVMPYTSMPSRDVFGMLRSNDGWPSKTIRYWIIQFLSFQSHVLRSGRRRI